MTIREVAKQAGVSLQTVSNVLNGRHNMMSEETRKRVQQVIEELDYHPNLHARGLRSQQTFTVGYLTVDPAARFLADPFHTAILSGMADTLRARDYGLLVQALAPGRVAETFQRLFRQRRFDGTVIHLSGDPAARRHWLKDIAAADLPFVLLEESVRGPKAASVRANDRQGAYEATAYLHSRGHRRIAFLTVRHTWPAFEERWAGYQDALSALGLRAPKPWVAAVEQPEAVRVVVEAVLRRAAAPTAVLCGNDVLAVGALHAARAVGRNIPDEFAVIGFNNFDFCQYVEPPLSTVALPAYDMGRTAAELLLDACKEGTFAQTDVVVPTRLVLRGTA